MLLFLTFSANSVLPEKVEFSPNQGPGLYCSVRATQKQFKQLRCHCVTQCSVWEFLLTGKSAITTRRST
eukprot:6371301-Amphidinium_carterae.1